MEKGTTYAVVPILILLFADDNRLFSHAVKDFFKVCGIPVYNAFQRIVDHHFIGVFVKAHENHTVFIAKPLVFMSLILAEVVRSHWFAHIHGGPDDHRITCFYVII